MRTESLRYAVRSTTLSPLVLAASVSTVIVAARHGHEAALPLQVAAIALASGIGFALDDPAFEVMAASPTSLLRRRALRLLVTVPPAIALWAALLGWQGTEEIEEALALVALAAGVFGLTLGIAGVAARRSPHGSGGVAVAPTLFVLLIASTTVPPRWRPLPLGDVPGGWPQIYAGWTSAAALGILIFALSSRDPARGRFR